MGEVLRSKIGVPTFSSTRLMLSLRGGCEIYSFLAAAEKLRACQTQAVDTLNRHWGPQSAQLHFTEQYRNMKEKLAEHPQLVELARSACLAAGITPRMAAGRGGTDGARLTFRGLPCPNLGLGGWGYHSPYEHITVQAMEKVSAILRELIFLFGQTDSI